ACTIPSRRSTPPVAPRYVPTRVVASLPARWPADPAGGGTSFRDPDHSVHDSARRCRPHGSPSSVPGAIPNAAAPARRDAPTGGESALPALEIALGEEVRIQVLIELHVADVDHRLGPGARRLHLDVLGRGNGADRSHLALVEALLGGVAVLIEFEPAGDEVLCSEPEDDAVVADVLALGRELDHVSGDAAERLVAAQLRGGVGFRPGGHLLEEIEVV